MLHFSNVKLAAAPIGWANDDLVSIGASTTFEQIISEMALAGYQGTEIGNKYPRDTTVLTKALALRNLEVASAWFSSYLLTKPYAEVLTAFSKHVHFLKVMGAKVVVVSEQSYSIQQAPVGLFAHKPVVDDHTFRLLAEKLNDLGAYAQSQGLNLVFHHHMGTIVQTANETRKLLAYTDPTKVFLLFDTGHFFMSGDDPAPLILEFGSRIKHVHLKDVRSEIVEQMREQQTSFLDGVLWGMFTTPGTGSLDFASIFQNLHQINYQGWMVVEAEQDPEKANPFEYALNALAYIKQFISYE
ncbi:inosose dehydratase [Mycoplasmoides fastidiosum]|uniref:Inosose dehydratase n=1 Tax=Mycoplasmoides fastidiosum TaxID=92758 RepID=A0ABU0LZI1_9BACT|nr:myo-inosose-2 dehydratase [Mycoplasmoides fastidiosum]MDQ0514117.1 inosose dehydratase [Mycoplasmoides fastidiosum]UUD37475.1 myo-inosose-2 dehydratase [Mycoplasmoides fastidiosum]